MRVFAKGNRLARGQGRLQEIGFGIGRHVGEGARRMDPEVRKTEIPLPLAGDLEGQLRLQSYLGLEPVGAAIGIGGEVVGVVRCDDLPQQLMLGEHHVAADPYERLVADRIPGLIEGSQEAHGPLLDENLGPDLLEAGHMLGPSHHQGLEPQAGGERQQPVEDRLPAEVHEQFGPAAAGRTEPGAETRGEDHHLHVERLSGTGRAGTNSIQVGDGL